ncbi:MAG: hypothetical protein ACI8WB_005701, partial [Phenylobacterium sp.]
MKLSTAVSCSLLLLCSAVVADNHPSADYKWSLSGFASYIHLDSDRLLDTIGSGDDEDVGFAGAFGYRFNPKWEVRAIINSWDLDGDAFAWGADALYFLTDDQLYLIGGIKHENINEIV